MIRGWCAYRARMLSTEHPAETNLTASGIQQIGAANHQVDLLLPIVDADGELIGPISSSIANQDIATLV